MQYFAVKKTVKVSFAKMGCTSTSKLEETRPVFHNTVTQTYTVHFKNCGEFLHLCIYSGLTKLLKLEFSALRNVKIDKF